MRHVTRWTVAVLLAAGAIPAQRQLTARSFLPPDYNGEVRVEMARIVDSGMWDAVERSVFRLILAEFRSRMGFDLADLDSVRFATRMIRHEDGTSERRGAWILEGTERVGVARMPDDRRARFAEESIDGIRYLTDGRGNELISPRPGLLVVGQGDLVSAILRDDVRPGVPVPELQSLTAAPHTLALAAAIFPPPELRRPYDLSPFPADWFTDDDPPLALRIRLATDADQGNVFLEMLVRFENGERGPARLEAELRGLPESLVAMDDTLKPVAALLAGLQLRTAERELFVTLPLGDDPEAAGNRIVDLAAKIVPAGLVRESAPAALPAPVTVEAEPPAPPVEKKKDGGKEDGR